MLVWINEDGILKGSPDKKDMYQITQLKKGPKKGDYVLRQFMRGLEEWCNLQVFETEKEAVDMAVDGYTQTKNMGILLGSKRQIALEEGWWYSFWNKLVLKGGSLPPVVECLEKWEYYREHKEMP